MPVQTIVNGTILSKSSKHRQPEENIQPLDFSLSRHSVEASSQITPINLSMSCSNNSSAPMNTLPHSVVNLINLDHGPKSHVLPVTANIRTRNESNTIEVPKDDAASTMQSASELMPPPKMIPAQRSTARGSQPHLIRPLFMKSTDDMDARYQAFRENALNQMYGSNGGPITTNPNMSRAPKRENGITENGDSGNHSGNHSGDTEVNTEIKNSSYFERRRRNNLAAKKSRDRRRINADETVIRHKFLEKENFELGLRIEAQSMELLSYLSELAE